MMELRDTERDLWQSAAINATERGCVPRRRAMLATVYEPERSAAREEWAADSASQPGVVHAVVVEVIYYERVRHRAAFAVASTVACSCPAGITNQPCYHAAAVVDLLHAWPFTIARQKRMDGL